MPAGSPRLGWSWEIPPVPSVWGASLPAGGSVEFSSTGVPGPPARLRLSSGFAALSIGETRQLDTQVHDAFGNEIEDAHLTLESRAPGVISIQERTARGVARGPAVLVARAGTATDSAAYAVLDEGEVAVAFVDSGGRAFARAEAGAAVELRLVIVQPGGGGFAALQGRVNWTGDATYASSGQAGDGFSWAANTAETAAGLLRFAAWHPEATGDGMALGLTILTAPPDPGASVISIDVEVAGDAFGRDMTVRVVPVSTAITVTKQTDR